MKLKSKRNVGARKVFDIAVANNHNFVVSHIVVHNCGNYKVANFLNRSILNSRLLFHKDADSKLKILRMHQETEDPTVLVSPSMGEGVDLSDDLSRFQIFCKVPFPYLGDEVTKRRMERDPMWYSVQTARNVIQATGRSVRNSSDFAVTYILDSCWDDFLRRNRGLFPDSFLAALK
jgi:Rad3-related DNA helicase